MLLQYISLFFSQKKQPNLTRAVENIQINEEDNEIRYFVLLNVCIINMLDIATSHAVHILVMSGRSCFLSEGQLPTGVPPINYPQFLTSCSPLRPTSPITSRIPSHNCLCNPSQDTKRGHLSFISTCSSVSFRLPAVESGGSFAYSPFPRYGQDALSPPSQSPPKFISLLASLYLHPQPAYWLSYRSGFLLLCVSKLHSSGFLLHALIYLTSLQLSEPLTFFQPIQQLLQSQIQKLYFSFNELTQTAFL